MCTRSRTLLYLDAIPMLNPELIWGVFARSIGLALTLNFISVIPQILSLVGARGLEPAKWLFQAVKRDLNPLLRFLRFPSLFLIHSGDRTLLLVSYAGLAASLGIVVGLGAATPYLFLTAWVCWLSIQISNPTLFSFPWDLLLSECAFFGIFLPPLVQLPDLRSQGVPLAAAQFYFSWLLFRVIFGMGLTRFKKRGETERDHTYIFHFLQWQPMPTRIAYYARALPLWFHKLSFAFLFWAEVVAALAIFGSPEFRALALVSIALLQLGIWATGNYGTFNLLSLILCIPLCLPIPSVGAIFHLGPPSVATVLTALLAVHFLASFPSVFIANFWTGSLWLYQRQALQESDVGRLLRPLAAFLRFFAPFRLVNSYGVFRHQEIYVRDRLIVRLQGSLDGKTWRDYEPRFLSSQENRKPRFFAPYHPRMDHFLFYGLCEPHSLKMFMFMACNPYYFHPFCLSEKLVQKLLRADPVAIGFFRSNPFPEGQPEFIRYGLFKYQFTTPSEKTATGNWWKTELLGTSDPISRMAVDEGAGIRETYDRFISETQSRGTFNVREFLDPRSGERVPMHLHCVRRSSC